MKNDDTLIDLQEKDSDHDEGIVKHDYMMMHDILKTCQENTKLDTQTIFESIAWDFYLNDIHPCFNCIVYGWTKNSLSIDYPGDGRGRCSNHLNHINDARLHLKLPAWTFRMAQANKGISENGFIEKAREQIRKAQIYSNKFIRISGGAFPTRR